ncbi:DUF624 domain-containing protein [Actinomyces sp. ZJ308]|uniref:DUF624 domain-containing protein n=1 Tax=Actinomyces sp. ZJ308 TaxID=2708342 RepID=UPI00141F0278|nr:DUF624 domain-containing protein [Actinomyces sp. ZJ308]
MALFPGPDSPAYRAWSAVADVVILNALTLAGCLPVVTAGASLTACARVAGQMAADDAPAVLATWWRSFRLNLRQSLAWWLPVLVLAALGAWEYLVLADGVPADQYAGQPGDLGSATGAVSGLVLAGGALLAAILIWLLPLAAFFDASLVRHLSNAARLAVGRLGITVICLVIVIAPVGVLWALPSMGAAVLWFMVLIGPAFQSYLIALLQRSTIAALAVGARTSPHPNRPQ